MLLFTGPISRFYFHRGAGGCRGYGGREGPISSTPKLISCQVSHKFWPKCQDEREAPTISVIIISSFPFHLYSSTSFLFKWNVSTEMHQLEYNCRSSIEFPAIIELLRWVGLSFIRLLLPVWNIADVFMEIIDQNWFIRNWLAFIRFNNWNRLLEVTFHRVVVLLH